MSRWGSCLHKLQDVLDEGPLGPRVTFDKAIVLENARLARLYQFMWLATMVFIIWKSIYIDTFLKEIGVIGSVDLWVDGFWHEEPLLERQRQLLESDVCARPHANDYAWNDDWIYVNNTCRELCTQNAQAQREEGHAECIPNIDSYREREGGILFVTYSQRTVLNPGDTFVTANQMATENQFVPFVEAFTLRMDIARMVSSSTDEELQRLLEHVHEQPLVILRRAGEAFRAYHSGESLRLTVAELLDVAGVELDAVQPQLGENALDPKVYPGIDERGPLQRMGGVELTMEVSFYNYPKYDYSAVYSGGFPGSVFYVDIIVNQAVWVSQMSRDVIDADGRELVVRDHGILVGYRVRGFQRYIDVSFMIVSIMSALVLLQIPKKLAMWITMFGMGQLSKIYKNMLRERMNLHDHCASMAVKMIQISSTHKELLGDSERMSKQMVHERLYDILKHRHDIIDHDEIEHFVQYVFTAFENDSASKRHNLEEVHVDEYGLAHAYLKTEQFSLERLVALFSRDRFEGKSITVGLIERFFMERELHTAIISSAPPAANLVAGIKHALNGDLLGSPSSRASAAAKRLVSQSSRLTVDGVAAVLPDASVSRKDIGTLQKIQQDASVAPVLPISSESGAPGSVSTEQNAPLPHGDFACSMSALVQRVDALERAIERFEAHEATVESLWAPVSAEPRLQVFSEELRSRAAQLGRLEERQHMLIPRADALEAGLSSHIEVEARFAKLEGGSERLQAEVNRLISALLETTSPAMQPQMAPGHVGDDFSLPPSSAKVSVLRPAAAGESAADDPGGAVRSATPERCNLEAATRSWAADGRGAPSREREAAASAHDRPAARAEQHVHDGDVVWLQRAFESMHARPSSRKAAEA